MSKTFQLGLEVMYANLNSAQTNRAGSRLSLSAPDLTSRPFYTVCDQDQWAVRFRVNRPFYP